MAIVDALWSMFGNKNEGNKVTRVKATVLRRDEDGTVWVHIEGGVTETPVYSTTTDVAQGDVVTVRVEGGKAYIDGSNSDPSVGVRRMIQAIEPIAKDSKVAKALAGAADEASAAAQRIATEAQEAAQAVSQYFWQRSEDTQSDGAGTGAFVTEETQEDFLDAAADGFPDLSDQHPHHNLLMNSLGIMLRTGLRNLVSITRSAIAFYDGLGNDAANVVASFGRYGAQIGSSGGQHVSIDSNGFSTYDGNTRTSLIGNGTIDIGASDKGGLSFGSVGGLKMRGKSGNVLFSIAEFSSSSESGTFYGFSIRNAYGMSRISMYPADEDPTKSILNGLVASYEMLVGDSFKVFTYREGIGFLEALTVIGDETTAMHNLVVEGDSTYDAMLTVKNEYGGNACIHVTGRDNDEYTSHTLIVAPSFIGFETPNLRSARAIQFFAGSDAYGDAIVIGDGGMFVAGAGESAESLYNAKIAGGGSPGNEDAYLSADSTVYIVPNCNTIANRIEYNFSSGGLDMKDKSLNNTCNLELRGNDTTNGGWIDFHYNKSTADYTSRIIEDESGCISFYNTHVRIRGTGNRSFINRATNITQATAPSATQYVQTTITQDKAANQIGHDEYSIGTSRQITHNFAAVRQKTNDTTWTWYQCSMTVAVNGTVTYSINSPANFRSAISAASTSAASQSAAGLMSAADKKKLDGIATGAQVNPTCGYYTSGVISAASGITITTQQAAVYAGHVIQVTIRFKPTAAKSGNVTIGTLASAYRPSYQAGAQVAFGGSGSTGWVDGGGACNVRMGNLTAGTEYYFWATFVK